MYSLLSQPRYFLFFESESCFSSILAGIIGLQYGFEGAIEILFRALMSGMLVFEMKGFSL